jgi:hypothetical protein
MSHFLHLSFLLHEPSLQPLTPLFTSIHFSFSVISTINVVKVIDLSRKEWYTSVKEFVGRRRGRKTKRGKEISCFSFITKLNRKLRFFMRIKIIFSNVLSLVVSGMQLVIFLCIY